jgi:hypothetical protein
MEAIFRFNQVHPAARRAEIDSITLSAPTGLQGQLAAAHGAGGFSAMKAPAQAFVASSDFVTGETTQSDAVLGALRAVVAAVRELPESGMGAAITSALGRSVTAFLDDPDTARRIGSIKDSILAIKLLPAEHHRPIDRLVDLLRAHELLVRSRAQPSFPSELVAAVLRLPIALPQWIVRRPSPRTGHEVSTVRGSLTTLAARYDDLDRAIIELQGIPSTGFQSSPQEAMPEQLPPVGLRPTALFEAEVKIREKILEGTLFSAAASVSRTAPPSTDAVMGASIHLKVDTLTPDTPGIRAGKGGRFAMTGRPAFVPVKAQLGMMLADQAVERLSPGTRETLSKEGLDPRMPTPQLLSALLRARTDASTQSHALVRPLLERPTFRRRGGTLIRRTDSVSVDAVTLSPSKLATLLDQLFPAVVTPQMTPVPLTHADLMPAGVMELLIVRQSLKGYEKGEIAHVENVLLSEVRERIVRSRTETETTFLSEVERETERTNSLETTDRFEIRREAQAVLQERANVRGALTVSGSYGPSVDFQASGDASWSRDSQESESSSSTVAREVTQSASERLAERILNRQTRRTTIELEETDRHTFDNTEGTDHVVGVYQWLTKLYEAQVYNYGKRSLYELMVPEPAATLLESFRRSRAEAVEIAEPPRFSHRPQDLSPDTYQHLVALYGASGVKPPPQPYVTQGYNFSTGGESEEQEFTNSTLIKVPEGYRAVQATVGIAVMVWDNWCVDVVIGRRIHRFASGNQLWTTDLNDETESVPFGVATDKVGDIAVAVEVHCVATQRAVELWQSDVHGQLMDAYRARVSEYEAKLAALEADAPPDVRSRSAYRNREMMVDELKRSTVSLLTEQHFELFNAMDSESNGLPRIRFGEARAEGAYVRFFEQAFEWENMSWICYPYFWGRRDNWFDRMEIQDGDSEFEHFLKAGYARVVLPVRPGFEAAVDHFRVHGEPWMGGALPTVTDALYLPIAEELAARLGRPGSEVPSGEPWEVRVPSTLVILRRADNLPAWLKQPDGTWRPDDQ